MDMSECVPCWRVQTAHSFTDIQREGLVKSLASVNGAITECSPWGMVRALAPSSSTKAAAFLNLRALLLWEALLQPAFDEGRGSVDPFIVLRLVIDKTYEGEKPEKVNIAMAFPGDDFFYRDYFWPLYLDSLLLRRADVRAYCRANQIRQVREVKGLMFEDRDAPADEAQAPATGKALSVEERTKHAEQWRNHLGNVSIKQEREAVQIVGHRFLNKGNREIFNMVRPGEKNVRSGTIRKWIHDRLKLAEKIAKNANLPSLAPVPKK